MNELKWIRVGWCARGGYSSFVYAVCACARPRVWIDAEHTSIHKWSLGVWATSSHELHNALANILFVNCDFNVTAGRCFHCRQISSVAQQCVKFMILLAKQKCKRTRNIRVADEPNQSYSLTTGSLFFKPLSYWQTHNHANHVCAHCVRDSCARLFVLTLKFHS